MNLLLREVIEDTSSQLLLTDAFLGYGLNFAEFGMHVEADGVKLDLDDFGLPCCQTAHLSEVQFETT